MSSYKSLNFSIIYKMGKKKLFCCLIVLAALLCFISIFLLAFSFPKVPMNNVGRMQNIHSKAFDSGIYEPGRYYGGLIKSFITFPTNLQQFRFGGSGATEGAISTLTLERTVISISAGVTYRIRKELLDQLYSKYPNKNYEQKLISNAKSEIQAKATNYPLNDFYTSRRRLAYEFARFIRDRFEEDYCELVDFRLYEITIQAQVETQLIQTAVSTRQVETQQEQARISQLQGSMANLAS